MNHFVFVFSAFIGMLVVSCTFNKKGESDSIRYIQGKWVFDVSTLPDIGSGRTISKIRDNCGFEFYKDSCNMRCAFYRKRESNVCEGMTTGFMTNFDIKDDSLRIWDVEGRSWHKYLIKKITKDSLVLFDDNMQYDIKYTRPSKSKNDFFDGIIISKLFIGDGYECVDESFYFDKAGHFYYQNSIDESFVYQYNQKVVDRVFQGYDHLDLSFLKDEYIGGGTGASVHYSISFIKNGSVIKRVIDHQNTGPDELLQGYTRMINDLMKLKGEKVNVNHNILKLVEEECSVFYQKMGIN